MVIYGLLDPPFWALSDVKCLSGLVPGSDSDAPHKCSTQRCDFPNKPGQTRPHKIPQRHHQRAHFGRSDGASIDVFFRYFQLVPWGRQNKLALNQECLGLNSFMSGTNKQLGSSERATDYLLMKLKHRTKTSPFRLKRNVIGMRTFLRLSTRPLYTLNQFSGRAVCFIRLPDHFPLIGSG